MKKILKSLQEHKHFITWTICYVFVLWAVLYYMFGFCIFNSTQWHRLAHAQLHGFVGFVFGAIIFAAIPLYISTSILIIRNKKPLLTIPLPKFNKETKSESSDKQQSETKSDSDEPTLAENIPPEIRSAFIRATKHPLDIKINLPDSESATDTDTTSDTLLPLPSDFDITLDTEQDDTTVPTFTDFNFGNTTDTNTSDVIKYLNNTDTDYTIINDIIITDKHAIAVHDDADFWVCDNEQWFATGKSKPSPILAVKSAAEQNNVKPVLYLSETNIMDIDTLIPQWESDGVTVITDINNL